MNVARPWFPRAPLFIAAAELLRDDGDRSAALWIVRTTTGRPLQECDAHLRRAACEQVLA